MALKQAGNKKTAFSKKADDKTGLSVSKTARKNAALSV